MICDRGTGNAGKVRFALTLILAIAAGSITFGMSGSAAAQDTPRDISDCARIEDDKLRLACYDSFARKPRPAASPGQTDQQDRKAEPVPVPDAPNPAPVPVPTPAPVPAPGEAPTVTAAPAAAAQPRTTERQEFGGPPKTKEESAKELQNIEVMITKGQQNHLGKWSVLTEDGQVWRQTDKARLRIRSFPVRATIRKASFGGYFLRLDSGGQSIRVVRDK